MQNSSENQLKLINTGLFSTSLTKEVNKATKEKYFREGKITLKTK